MGEGVLKKHIYLWTINIVYSCRETFFQVYTLRVGVSSKIPDKRQGGVGLEMTIQERKFDRKFEILFEVEKNMRGGGSLQY